jgi:hypothetical protein
MHQKGLNKKLRFYIHLHPRPLQQLDRLRQHPRLPSIQWSKEWKVLHIQKKKYLL